MRWWPQARPSRSWQSLNQGQVPRWSNSDFITPDPCYSSLQYPHLPRYKNSCLNSKSQLGLRSRASQYFMNETLFLGPQKTAGAKSLANSEQRCEKWWP